MYLVKSVSGVLSLVQCEEHLPARVNPDASQMYVNQTKIVKRDICQV